VGCAAGDEVVMVANAGMYAATAALAIGAVPVFADIDPDTLLLDTDRAAASITDRTGAVVATHLYGNVVDVPLLRAALPEGLPVIEDGAQAHGARLDGAPVGSLADVAAFSFYPTKNLGALGDAGAVVSNDPEVIARARALRQYGWTSRYHATLPGGRNSRMDELQAAVLLELLPDLGPRNARRVAIRDRYEQVGAARLPLARITPGASHVAHLCVGCTPRRDETLAALEGAGISCAVHYPVPDHRQPALAGRPFRHDGLEHTERACGEVLSLPCFPEMTDAEVDRVVAAIGALP
jgi:aminotransferase EvaB